MSVKSSTELMLYVVLTMPTLNKAYLLFWLVTCCCCMVYSSTGWRTAVYSTLHKVVSPGEFLMDQFRNDVALWVKNYEDATMPYLLNQKMYTKSADPNLFTLATVSSDQTTKTRLTTSELTEI